MSSSNVEIVRRAVEAFNRHDVRELEGLFARPAEIVPLRAALEDTVYRGANAVSEFFADSDESWEGLRYGVEDINDLGDVLLFRARLQGRGRTSGANVDVEVTSVVRFEDGKIASLRAYQDHADALAAAGLRPDANTPDAV